MTKQEIHQHYAVPPKVKKLFIKALLIFIGWEVVYQLILRPLGIPDKELTQLIVSGTVKSLSYFFTEVYHVGSIVYVNGKASISIAPECNGLELIALYLGIMILMPTKWSKMLKYAIIGTSIIILLNIVRCALLAYLYQHNADVAHFAHKYAFKLTIYIVVFIGWFLYSKNYQQDEK